MCACVWSTLLLILLVVWPLFLNVVIVHPLQVVVCLCALFVSLYSPQNKYPPFFVHSTIDEYLPYSLLWMSLRVSLCPVTVMSVGNLSKTRIAGLQDICSFLIDGVKLSFRMIVLIASLSSRDGNYYWCIFLSLGQFAFLNFSCSCGYTVAYKVVLTCIFLVINELDIFSCV